MSCSCRPSAERRPFAVPPRPAKSAPPGSWSRTTGPERDATARSNPWREAELRVCCGKVLRQRPIDTFNIKRSAAWHGFVWLTWRASESTPFRADARAARRRRPSRFLGLRLEVPETQNKFLEPASKLEKMYRKRFVRWSYNANDPHSTAGNVFISTSKQFPQTSELFEVTKSHGLSRDRVLRCFFPWMYFDWNLPRLNDFVLLQIGLEKKSAKKRYKKYISSNELVNRTNTTFCRATVM